MKVLILGAAGQDGRLMCDYAMGLGHDVYPFYGDITFGELVDNMIRDILPDIIFNFAAISAPKDCNNVYDVLSVNALCLNNWLEAVRKSKIDCRFFSAGSVYEKSDKPSLYAESKRIAASICNEYRRNYNMFVVHAKLFPHISKYGNKSLSLISLLDQAKEIVKKMHAGSFYFDPILTHFNKVKNISSAYDMIETIWDVMNCQVCYHNVCLGSNNYISQGEFLEKIFERFLFNVSRTKDHIFFTVPKTGERIMLAKNKCELEQGEFAITPSSMFNQNFKKIDEVICELLN